MAICVYLKDRNVCMFLHISMHIILVLNKLAINMQVMLTAWYKPYCAFYLTYYGLLV